tara:strand:- start:3658 stop:4146 length:489 start_codon:yes stop_codon:yes gene_type:complete
MKTQKVKKVTKKVSLETENGALEVLVKDKTKLIANIVTLKTRNGYSRQNLVKYVMQEWDVKVSRAYILVREAIKEIEEIQKEVVVDAYFDSIATLEDMKQAAMLGKDGIPDFRLALDIQKEINKVSQLYVIKTEVSLRVEQPLFGEEEENQDTQLNIGIDDI